MLAKTDSSLIAIVNDGNYDSHAILDIAACDVLQNQLSVLNGLLKMGLSETGARKKLGELERKYQDGFVICVCCGYLTNVWNLRSKMLQPNIQGFNELIELIENGHHSWKSRASFKCKSNCQFVYLNSPNGIATQETINRKARNSSMAAFKKVSESVSARTLRKTKPFRNLTKMELIELVASFVQEESVLRSDWYRVKKTADSVISKAYPNILGEVMDANRMVMFRLHNILYKAFPGNMTYFPANRIADIPRCGAIWIPEPENDDERESFLRQLGFTKRKEKILIISRDDLYQKEIADLDTSRYAWNFRGWKGL